MLAVASASPVDPLVIRLAQLDRWPLAVPAPPSTPSLRSAEEWACCHTQQKRSESEKCLSLVSNSKSHASQRSSPRSLGPAFVAANPTVHCGAGVIRCLRPLRLAFVAANPTVQICLCPWSKEASYADACPDPGIWALCKEESEERA